MANDIRIGSPLNPESNDVNPQNIFNYIDSLQDVDSVKYVQAFLDNNKLKKIFWQSFKEYFAAKSDLEKQKAKFKIAYLNHYYGSSIPLNRNINLFTAPHAFYGIFISNAAKIGKGCTIFQGVTIGSNTLLDSKSSGAPVIGDNVYIGAGAKIIGNVKIGNNVRIGAGCCVTRDVSDNCTVVQASPIVIQKNTPQDNRWFSLGKFLEIKAAKSAKSAVINTPPIQN